MKNLKIFLLVVALFLGSLWAAVVFASGKPSDFGIESGHYYREALIDADKELYDKMEEKAMNYGRVFWISGQHSIAQIEQVINCIFADHPELYNFSKEVQISDLKIGQLVFLGYNWLPQDEVENELNNFVGSLNGLSDWDIIHQTYAHLLDITYSDETVEDATIYGAVVKKKANCEGISETFSVILSMKGIPNKLVSSENHQWNAVYIDGQWLQFDVTWEISSQSEGWSYYGTPMQ